MKCFLEKKEPKVEHVPTTGAFLLWRLRKEFLLELIKFEVCNFQLMYVFKI
jgi:hypothetical protein